MRYEYRVFPFIGQVKDGQGPKDVSKQLQSVINQFAEGGWEFYQMADVNIREMPGCWLGGSATYYRFDQLIFRREVS